MNIQRKPFKPRMRPVKNIHHGHVWVCIGHGISVMEKSGTDAFHGWQRAAARRTSKKEPGHAN